jgi:hypothetical protein
LGIYECASGHWAEEQPMGPLPEPPPVPTTAIFSRTDGVIAWQCCVETAGPRVENIAVESSHCGLGHHPAVVYAVGERLSNAGRASRYQTA